MAVLILPLLLSLLQQLPLFQEARATAGEAVHLQPWQLLALLLLLLGLQ